MFHFENYWGQSVNRGNNDDTFDDIIRYLTLHFSRETSLNNLDHV